MIIENIIEICVAIDIAIFGIAYPIIVDKISNIGEKYNSEYISILFNNDFPQKSVKINVFSKQYEISKFKLTLFCTIFTFLFLIFNCDPLFGWDNLIINNSAKLLVLVATTLLTVLFFIWLDKLTLYNGKSTSLLRHIVFKYNQLDTNAQGNSYYLKSINELTFYAIDKQDEHLQETLLDFYSEEFAKIRKNHDKTQPLIYPIDLYFLTNRLNAEFSFGDNKRLLAIEHRAVSSTWLLGEDFECITISNETYSCLWRNLCTICINDKFVKMHWAFASQYFDWHLQNVNSDYNYVTNEVSNLYEIEKRDEERNRFLEFHCALGGLLLYSKSYDTLLYMFEYSQSQPPKYVLLPDSMTTIFQWIENFRNEFKNRRTPIDVKYYFPGLDNLGNSKLVNYWICCYIILLFIKQYSLNEDFTFQNYISQPALPDDIIELENWLNTVTFFEKCLLETINKIELIKALNFEKTVEDNRTHFENFISDTKVSILDKISNKRLTAELSLEKIAIFEENSSRIISTTFDSYKIIFNQEEFEKIEEKLKTIIKGDTIVLNKAAFTDGDRQHIFYETLLANQIAKNNIQKGIADSFFISKTKKYLLNQDNILLGLEKLIAANKDAIIICISLNYDLDQILTHSKFSNILLRIHSYQSNAENSLMILNKSDLPFIEHKEIELKEREKLQLKKINERLKIYSSVIDLNIAKNKEIRDIWQFAQNDNNLKVQLSIRFLAVIYWNKNRNIIQINLSSKYKEQGIQNKLSDLEILPIYKNKY